MWGGGADRGEYGRYGNPTVRQVEKRIAALEGAGDAIFIPDRYDGRYQCHFIYFANR